MSRTSTFARFGLVLLLAGLLAEPPANAQASQNHGFGVGNIDEGLVVGAIVGIAAVVGLGVTYLVLHNRGIAVGCIVESGGKKTLVVSGGKVYTLLDTSQPVPVGERAKLKGHRTGPASAPSFRVDSVQKDYGPCHP
ncbi:MAG: hypothetical protein ABSB67_06475 [Bryobacteraceae bacterium]